MDSFLYTLPWTTPAPIGTILGTGFAPLAFVLAVLLPIMDILIYYPFFKVYDKQMVEKELTYQEDENIIDDSIELNEPVIATNSNSNFDEKNVLVLCAGGGTSGLLANALAKGAAEYNVPIYSAAGSYGAHYDMMKDFDLIVLAPQVASNYEDIKKDTDRLGIELVKTQGKEYISLTRDPKGALNFVMNILSTSNE